MKVTVLPIKVCICLVRDDCLLPLPDSAAFYLLVLDADHKLMTNRK